MFEFLQPPGWAKPSGYANGIAARGKMIFVAGQIGWNEQCKFESDDLVEQTGQTLKNVAAVLRAGGAGPEHIVSMTWFLLDRKEYSARLKEIGAAYRERHGPELSGHDGAAGIGADRGSRQGRNPGDRDDT